MSEHTSSRASLQPTRQLRPMSSLQRRVNGIALALALAWLMLIALTISPEVDDFKWYWQSARSFLQTGDPYLLKDDPGHSIITQQPAAQETTGNSSRVAPIFAYGYPPLFTYAMQPFGMIHYRVAQWIWFALNIVLLFALIVLCQHLAGAALARRWWGVLILAMLIAPPTRLSLQLGQVSILVAVMLVGCLALEGRPYAAGLLLATASWIKLTPAVIGLRYTLWRPRSVLWWTIGTGAALLIISLLAYGVDPYASFINSIVFGREYPYAAEHNISLYGFWNRLLSDSLYAVPLLDSPALARALTVLTSLALLGLCVWATDETTDRLGNQLRFCLWLCTMMVVSPSNGYYTLVALLLPLLAVLRYLELRPDRAVRRWLIVGTALACIPPTWSDGQPALYNTVHIGWGLLALTPSLYGLLIYTILLAVLLRRERPRQDIDSHANDDQRLS
jgi:hypothetical protein